MRPQRQFTFTKRQCIFCKKKIDIIDYKDTQLLSRFLTPWSKIKAGHDTGTCSKHQRRLSEALKRARFLALMPYVKR
ncbi:MAG: 30S ribosomal protein S18 [Candidatus Berkelbacteria bacterium]|nr:30S ribosomal protein S18 [Candidatus Berkelbacteria bacterium]